MKTEKRPFHCLRWSLTGWIGTAALLAAGAVAADGAPQAGGSGPAITALEPDEGPVGTEVVIRGENFGPSIGAVQGTSGVSFGGVWASPSSWSQAEIRVEVPAGALSGPVVVTVGGVGSEGVAFTVTGPGTTGPAVGTVSPAQGAAGTEVVIRGADFGPPEGAAQGTAGVSFNGVAGTPASWNEAEIRVAVPEGATTGPVVVAVGGQVSNGVGFTVTAAGAPRPSIVSVSPELATAGTEVVIRGEHFGDPEGAAQGARGVSFGGVWAEPTLWSEAEIRVAVPEGTPSGLVVVAVEGEASDGVAFGVAGPAPVIETVDPTHGPEGTGVVIRGEHFGSPIAAVQGRSGVSFNGVWGVPTHWSGTEIRAPIPEGVASGLVAVTVGGQASNGVEFTVTAGGKGTAGAVATTVSAATSEGEENSGPEITSLSPEEGAVGTSVTVAGTGFGAAVADTSTVSFNGMRGVPTSWSETAVQVPVPAGAATGPVTVTVGGQKSNGVDFRLPPRITLEVNPSVVSEPDGEVTITVRTSPEDIPPADDMEDIVYEFAGTATRDADYRVRKQTIVNGQTVRATLTVIDDAVYEGDETIRIRAVAENFQGDPERSAWVVISLEDNDPPPLTLSVDTNLYEGDPVQTVTVTVPAGAEPDTGTPVTFTFGGTATPESDYEMEATVTLGAGDRSAEATLTVVDDEPFEIPERLTLQAGAAGYQSSPVVTIVIYDDNYTPLTLTADPPRVGEASGQRTATVTVSVEEGKEPATDTVVTILVFPSSTATKEIDYTLETALMILGGHRSATTTLEVTDDAVDEGKERIKLIAYGDSSSGLGQSSPLRIPLIDDDTAGVTVTPASLSLTEGGTGTYQVRLDSEPTHRVLVTIDSDNADLQVTPATLRFGPGNWSTPQAVTVEVAHDDGYDDESGTLAHEATSGDPNYEEITIDAVSVAVEDDELPPLALTVAPASVSEPNGTATLTVTVPEGAAPVTVAKVTLLHTGTATSGTDYTVEALTIKGGESSATVRLRVRDDTDYEGPETIGLQATHADYQSSAVLEIPLADDELPPLTLTVAPASISEPNGTATLTVTVPEGEAPAAEATLTLNHTGSATSGTDYTVGTLKIAAGELSGTARLAVTDDTDYDGPETIGLQATHSDYQASAVVEISLADDDLPRLTLTVAPASVSEPNGTATLTVTVPEAAAPVTVAKVTLLHTGTATSGTDYTVEALTIKGGESSATVRLRVRDDTDYEGPETIGLQATHADYQSSAVLEIPLADDELPPLTLTVAPASISEPNGTATLTVTVPEGEAPAAEATLTLNHTGSATSGTDYTVGTLKIKAGQLSGTATLAVTDDTDYDGPETIGLQATHSDYQASAVVEISLADDDLPRLTLTVAPASVGEADGQRTATLTVTVPEGAAPAAEATLTLNHTGSATNGTDYTVGTLKIAAGELSGTARLDVTDDTDYEGPETIRLKATHPDYQSSAVLEIPLADNDLPRLTLTVDTASVSEPNGTATLTVTVPAGEAPAAEATITLEHTGSATNGTDYRVGTLTIAGGDLSGTATLRVRDDETYEGTETIGLQADHSDYQASRVVEIALVDDELPPLTLTLDAASVSEPDGTATLTVSVPEGGAPDVDTTISIWDLGYARGGEDYRVGTLTIEDGDLSGTATLEVIDDAVYEGTEEIWIQAVKTGYEISPVLKIPLEDNEQNQAPAVSSPLPGLATNVGEAETVSLSSHFSDPEGHDLSYEATSSEPSVVTVSVSGSTLTVTGVAVGSSTITVTATDRPQDSDDRLPTSTTFTATVENRDPECEAIADQTVNVNVWQSLTASCTDPDGHELTYSHVSSDTSKVDTTTPSPKQSGFSVIGVAVGSATVTVTVTDGHQGSEMVEFDVTVPNRAPECSDIPVQTLLVAESQTVDLSQYCGDPDGHSLTYQASYPESSNVTASVDGSTLTLTGVAVGSSPIIVTATDPLGDFDDEEFTATVENRDPVCEDVDAQTVTAGQSKTLTVSCTDPDGHSLKYAPSTSNPSKVTVTNDGASLTITGIAGGTATVTVTASDGNKGSDKVTFTVTVPNRSPVVSMPIPDLTINVGEERTVTLSAHFSEPDGHDLAYMTVSSHPSMVRVLVSDGTLTIAAVAVTADPHPTVTVTATDKPDDSQASLSVSDSFTVTVVQNRRPVVDAEIPNITIRAGQTRTIDLSGHFSDPDGHSLTYSASGGNEHAGISVSGATLTITGKSRGSATGTATATDDPPSPMRSLSVSDSFTVTVVQNRRPVVDAEIPNITIRAGQTRTIDLSGHFSDPDGHSLTYSASGGNEHAGISVSGATLTITGKSRGSATGTATATDDPPSPMQSLSVSDSFTVTVVQNRRPVVDAEIPNITIRAGQTRTIDLSGHFSDPDGHSLTYSASGGNEHAGISVSGATLTITGKSRGSATGTATATDDPPSPMRSLSVSDSFTVTVVQNRRPVVDAEIPNITIRAGQTRTIDLSGHFSDPDGHSLTYSASGGNEHAGISVSGATLTITGKSRGSATGTATATDDPPSPMQSLSVSDSFTVTVVQNRRPVVDAEIPNITIRAGQTRTIDLSGHFSDPDGHSLTYSASGGNEHAGISVSGATLTITGKSRGSATGTATATDDPPSPMQSLSVSDSFTVTVVQNRRPVVDAEIPNITIRAGQTRTIDLSGHFSDPDGHSLTYSASGGNEHAGISVSGATLTITGKSRGSATGTATATDDPPSPMQSLSVSDSFTVTVVQNRRPVVDAEIPNITIRAGQTRTIDLSGHFSDPDGHSLTYSASGGNEHAGISVSGATLTITGKSRGSATGTATATDDPPSPMQSLSVSDSFTVTVVQNRRPVVDAEIPNITIRVGQTRTIDLSGHFSDPDGHSLTYSASGGNEHAGISVSGATLTITGKSRGSATGTATATDDPPSPMQSLSVSDSFTVTVVQNRRPVVDAEIPNITIRAGQTRTIDLSGHFSDPDGHSLTYSASGGNEHAGISVSGATLTITGKSRGSATGTATATDDPPSPMQSLSVSDSFTVTVVQNRRPVVDAEIPNITIRVGQTRTIDLSGHFSDPDGHSLTYSASGGNEHAGISVSGATLTITGKSRGSATGTATATDDPPSPMQSLSVSDSFTVTVVQNRRPVVDAEIPNITIRAGQTRTIDLSGHFSDPDGHSLTYSASGGNEHAGISVSGATLTITGKSRGSATGTATATDDPPSPMQSLSVSDSFTVTVVQNRRPVVDAEIPNITIRAGQTRTIDLSGHFSDPDGHSLTYSASGGNEHAGISVSGATLTITGKSRGSATGTATATDDPPSPMRSLSVSDSFTVTVVQNRRPVVDAEIPNITIRAGQTRTIDLSGHFSDPDGHSLTYSASGGNEHAGISVSGATLTITGKSRGSATGTATATDDPPSPMRSLSVSDSFTVTVVQPCTFTSISNQTVTVGGTTTVTVPADCVIESASTRATSIATVSISTNKRSLTITGVAAGSTTVDATVSGTDDSFTVTVVMPSPVISRISPNLGQTDTRATIYGANFGTDEGSVSFGGSSADINSWNDTWISVLVPLHLSVGTVPVSVTTAHSAGSKTSNSVTFRVTGGPVQRDEEEECEDAKDCPKGEGGEGSGEEGSSESGGGEETGEESSEESGGGEGSGED